MLESRHVDQSGWKFCQLIPDMKFEIKEVLVAGDRVIERGEVAGTPARDLFVPHIGESFKIMAIDIQTIKDGKIAKTFHMENWLSALGVGRKYSVRTRMYAIASDLGHDTGCCSNSFKLGECNHRELTLPSVTRPL
jgi:hypothetical protein